MSDRLSTPLNERGKLALPSTEPRRSKPFKLAAKRAAHRQACARFVASFRSLKCVTCYKTEAVSAHVLKQPEGALPLAVPLCFNCHKQFAKCGINDQLARFLRIGLDAYLLAQSLQRRTGDLPAMARAIEAHKQQAIRQMSQPRVPLR